MELRSENLTPLQRHLLTLLVKSRQGHGQQWLVVEQDCVCVEPVIQVLRGRTAVIAVRGLKAMGWLRARSNGGLELALSPGAVVNALTGVRRPERERDSRRTVRDDLEEMIEQAVSACLTFSSLPEPATRRAS